MVAEFLAGLDREGDKWHSSQWIYVNPQKFCKDFAHYTSIMRLSDIFHPPLCKKSPLNAIIQNLHKML